MQYVAPHLNPLLASPTTSVPSMDDSSSADEQFSIPRKTTSKKSYKSKKDDSESSREIRREYKKEWYEKNREKALAKMKEYYEKRKQAGTLHRRSVKQKKIQQANSIASLPTNPLPSLEQLQQRHGQSMMIPRTKFLYDEHPVCRTTSPWAYERVSLPEPSRRPDQPHAHLNLLCEVALMH